LGEKITVLSQKNKKLFNFSKNLVKKINLTTQINHNFTKITSQKAVNFFVFSSLTQA
jgi:hypothetical protein